jgi:hypothetical protein
MTAVVESVSHESLYLNSIDKAELMTLLICFNFEN